MATKRRDTRLHAEGAEFFVLSQLLIEGIHAFKAYTNFPGWDLIAVNPERKLQQTIQVKSRLPTGAKSFPIKNLDSDFVAFVVLNRGRRNNPTDPPSPPDVYVVPMRVVKPRVTRGGTGGSLS